LNKKSVKKLHTAQVPIVSTRESSRSTPEHLQPQGDGPDDGESEDSLFDLRPKMGTLHYFTIEDTAKMFLQNPRVLFTFSHFLVFSVFRFSDAGGSHF